MANLAIVRFNEIVLQIGYKGGIQDGLSDVLRIAHCKLCSVFHIVNLLLTELVGLLLDYYYWPRSYLCVEIIVHKHAENILALILFGVIEPRSISCICKSAETILANFLPSRQLNVEA